MKNVIGRWTLRVLLMAVSLMGTSCTSDVAGLPDLTQTTIWAGPTITFTKAVGADPALAENQDRLTDNVWITRGNAGGQIYNAVAENSANKETSPAGTLWAKGTTDELMSLSFTNFRAAVDQPRRSTNQDLVMLLVDDNIAIDVRITNWNSGQGQNNGSGFTYERSSN